jgi:hypothetical protein
LNGCSIKAVKLIGFKRKSVSLNFVREDKRIAVLQLSIINGKLQSGIEIANARNSG